VVVVVLVLGQVSDMQHSLELPFLATFSLPGKTAEQDEEDSMPGDDTMHAPKQVSGVAL